MNSARTLPPLSKISREIGASTATISRVLNGRAGVSDKMRAEVLNALESRGYPSKAVPGGFQALRNKVNTIAFAISTRIRKRIMQGDLFYSRHLMAFQAACADYGCYPLLIDHEQDASSNGGLRCVEESKVCGVVGEMGGHFPRERLELLRRQIPLVLLNNPTMISGVDAVLPDVRQAAREQLTLLHQLGHRSVACFRVYPGGWQDQRFWSEFQFYGMHLGLEQPPEFFEPLSFSEGGEREAVARFLDKMLALPRPPTAIVTQDRYASLIISDCRARGIEIPRQMSLFGYDDLPESITRMPLATYRQNFEMMAREAVRVMTDRIENPALPSRTLVIEGLTIRRDSIAAAPGS